MARAAFLVHGLACPLDALALERRLRRLRGVSRVYVNSANDTAYVTYQPAQIAPSAIRRAIRQEGQRAPRLRDAAIEAH
jgi:cation transport ATPase